LEIDGGEESDPRIFSIGYEGLHIDIFIEKLKQNGIERLIDIRQIPLSRKPGFSKKALQNELLEAGIGYFSIPELGTDKRSRERYRENGKIGALLEDFRSRLEENFERYEYLKSLAQARTSSIMCFEEDSKLCHRQIIETKLESDGFKVIHLWNGQGKRS
jgi:uncharacterized protein (DUF488 family)